MNCRQLALSVALLATSCATTQVAEPLSEQHAFLHRFVGDWSMTGWGLAQNEEGRVPFSGTFRCKPILEGRFIQMETEGTLGEDPWLANAIVGFDLDRKVFQSVSVTANGTSLASQATGTFNDARDGFVVSRESTNPATGESRTIRYEHRALDDRFELSIFRQADPPEPIGFYECRAR